MKEKILLALALILLPIEFELQNFGLSVMNQPDSFAFYFGFAIVVISLFAFGITGVWIFTLIQSIHKQSKTKKDEQI